MLTLILPGYSPHNREWAYEVKKNLGNFDNICVHEWGHWPSENRVRDSSVKFSLRNEIAEIIKLIDDKKVNVIAKSIGTRVTMHIAPLLKDQLQKVILCGIPTRGVSSSAFKTYKNGFSKLEIKNLIVFQNKKDPLANHDDVEKFVHKINPKVIIIEKNRKDHHYPYYEDFVEYFRN